MKVESMGESAVGLRITGDIRKNEKPHVRIVFPGGHLEVTRAVDGVDADYWVHVYVNNPRNKNYCEETDGETARVTDARLDQTDKGSSEANLGDFNRPELYHLAVRITRNSLREVPSSLKPRRSAIRAHSRDSRAGSLSQNPATDTQHP